MLVPPDDRGFSLGVGLFETILVTGGVPHHWQAHLDRLSRGCARLGLPAPTAAACTEAAAAALSAPGLRQGRTALRLTWTGGSGPRGLAGPATPQPRLVATAAPAPPPPAAVSLATVAVRRNTTSLTSRLKTLSYLDNVVARQAAIAAGADEALLLSTEGFVSGCAAANLFWFDNGALCTPSLDCGVLDGIMRAEVIRRAQAHGIAVHEVQAGRAALQAGEGAFITSSLIGAVPIRSLDGTACAEAPISKGFLILAAQSNDG